MTKQKYIPVLDGKHGPSGFIHCGNQLCCWGPAKSRKEAPWLKKKLKRKKK